MEENYLKQVQEVNEAIKLLSELTSRIDERTKILVENNTESKFRIEKLFDSQTLMLSRVGVVENKIGVLESRNNNSSLAEIKKDLKMMENEIDVLSDRLLHVEKEVGSQSNKWSNLIDFVFKVSQIVIGAIILWKIGVKP